MNLFVFNDPHGYNLNLVIDHCKNSSLLENNLFVNLTKKTIYKNDKAEYLDHNLRSFKNKIRTLPVITSVIFCPLDQAAAYFLKELKRVQPSARVRWVFWSYEFYHLPGSYQKLLRGYSLETYIKRNSGFDNLVNKVKDIAKTFLRIPSLNVKGLNNAYKHVSEFYSFLPQDHKNVQRKAPLLTAKHHQISFLSIEQISQSTKKSDFLSHEIIIGHSARLTGNHIEIFKTLSMIPINNKIFIPLAHGDADYKYDVQKNALEYFGNRVEFLEEELNMQAYFDRISGPGFAVFNFTMQEGLGNILFLLWNGSKVFLRPESSAYQQFKAWGLIVFSVESDLTEFNLSQLLDNASANANRFILEKMFCDDKVKEYWKPLFQ